MAVWEFARLIGFRFSYKRFDRTVVSTVQERQRRARAIVLALFGLLWERNLVSFPLSRWDWRGQLRSQGTFGENWLLLHEAVRRKWTTDRKLISHANGHPLLSQALRENVAFLRDDVLDAQRINLDRRTFRPRSADVKASAEKEIQQKSRQAIQYGGSKFITELYEVGDDAEEGGEESATLPSEGY